MNARRSFYLNSKQDDFVTVAGELRQSDLVDIPFAIPANDNVPVKLRLSARCRALLLHLIAKARDDRTLRMRRNRTLKRGGLLFLLLAGVVGCSLGDWHAAALRSTDLSASQNVALRFPDLSVFQTVALRFPGTKADSAEFVAPAGGPMAPIPAAAPGLASLAPHLHLLGLHASPALPPIGHSRFCLRYPNDCEVHGIDFRHRNIAMTPERWKELNDVNRKVNRNIVAEVTSGNGVTEEWLISPRAGDCKDYAITKQHELLARGWPSRALLLSEVTTPAGEHHLVLVVRVKDADLVLDNLNDYIRLVAMTVGEYDWIRVQSPQNPKFWVRRIRERMHTVMASD
jgi:predicted transglutaminase-like cysteine proteinase